MTRHYNMPANKFSSVRRNLSFPFWDHYLLFSSVDPVILNLSLLHSIHTVPFFFFYYKFCFTELESDLLRGTRSVRRGLKPHTNDCERMAGV